MADRHSGAARSVLTLTKHSSSGGWHLPSMELGSHGPSHGWGGDFGAWQGSGYSCSESRDVDGLLQLWCSQDGRGHGVAN